VIPIELGVLAVVGGLIGGLVLFIPILKLVLDISPYMFANAKVRAIEAGCLKDEKKAELAEASGIAEVIGMLDDTDYGSILSRVSDPITHEKVDMALQNHLMEIYKKVLRILPDDSREVVRRVMKLWDSENIKTCFRMAHAGIDVSERGEYLSPYGTLDEQLLRTLTEAKSVEEVLSSLKNTVYSDMLSEAVVQYKETNSMLPIELAIDRHTLTTAYEKVKFKKEENALAFQNMIGTRIDLINLKTLLRCKIEEVGPEEIEALLIPDYFKIDEKQVANMIKTEGIDELPPYLEGTPYADLVTNGVSVYKETNSVAPLEKSFTEFYTKSIKDFAAKFSMGVGPSLRLLVTKEQDARQISAFIKITKHNLEGINAKELIL